MIHRKTALPHHLFQITIGELNSAIPADTQKNQENQGWLEVVPLEKGTWLVSR
jgi:hypothetical protein